MNLNVYDLGSILCFFFWRQPRDVLNYRTVKVPDASEETRAKILAYSYTLAPAALGCAIGLLAGRAMKKREHGLVSAAVVTIAAGAAFPALIDYVSNQLNAPGRERGSRRRLDAIRHADVPHSEEAYDACEAYEVVKAG